MTRNIDHYYRNKISRKKKYVGIVALVICITILFLGYYVSENNNQLLFFVGLALLLASITYFFAFKELRIWSKIFRKKFPESYREILNKYVDFYVNLKPKDKDYFEQRIMYFLATKKITGVECEIDDKDKIFIAASAVMPVFSFRDFHYRNINEILVYPDSFDENYNITSPAERQRIAGIVGNGHLTRMMILSRKDLLKAFDDRIHANNVAIHEFVHLIDMADGAVDGVPKVLLDRSFSIPWVAQMHREMKLIVQRHSDLDPYAITNDAEFLSVVSEYFFDSPEKFEERHPVLYDSMCQIFKYSK